MDFLYARVTTGLSAQKSPDLKTQASQYVVGKCDQIVGSGEKLSSFCILTLGTHQGHYNRAIISATPIDHTQQYKVLIQLHMLELNVGKGRQVVSFMVGTATTLSGVFNAGYTIATVHVCYVLKRALVIMILSL